MSREVSGSRGLAVGRDRDARPGASTGSGGQKDRGRWAAGVARVEMMMENGKKEKKRGATTGGLYGRRPEERHGLYPGRAQHGATTGPGCHPGR